MNRPCHETGGDEKTNLVSRRMGRRYRLRRRDIAPYKTAPRTDKKSHTQRERLKTDFPLYLPREKLPYFSPTPFRVCRGRRPRRPTLRQNTRQICMLILRGTWTGDGHETGGDEKTNPVSRRMGRRYRLRRYRRPHDPSTAADPTSLCSHHPRLVASPHQRKKG